MLLITWMAISALLLHTLATMLVPQRVWDAISLRKLKRGLVRNAKRQIHLVVALLILIAVAGCGQRHCNRIEGWCVDGNVTEAYAKEIGEALRVIRPPLDGEIEVKNAVFTCSGSTTTRCAGEAYDMAHVAVVYDPTVHLGPGVGTTALEHELCHAAGNWSEDAANACAARAIALIIQEDGT